MRGSSSAAISGKKGLAKISEARTKPSLFSPHLIALLCLFYAINLGSINSANKYEIIAPNNNKCCSLER